MKKVSFKEYLSACKFVLKLEIFSVKALIQAFLFSFVFYTPFWIFSPYADTPVEVFNSLKSTIPLRFRNILFKITILTYPLIKTKKFKHLKNLLMLLLK